MRYNDVERLPLLTTYVTRLNSFSTRLIHHQVSHGRLCYCSCLRCWLRTQRKLHRPRRVHVQGRLDWGSLSDRFTIIIMGTMHKTAFVCELAFLILLVCDTKEDNVHPSYSHLRCRVSTWYLHQLSRTLCVQQRFWRRQLQRFARSTHRKFLNK